LCSAEGNVKGVADVHGRAELTSPPGSVLGWVTYLCVSLSAVHDSMALQAAAAIEVE
jgi:hypothetical protein